MFFFLFLLRFSYYLLQDSTFADVFQQVVPTSFQSVSCGQHKECKLCQMVSSKSMLGPGQIYTFYKNVSFVGPKTRLQLKSAIGYVKLRFHSTYFSPIVLSCLHFSHTLVKYCGEYFLAQEPRLGEVFSGGCDSIYAK